MNDTERINELEARLAALELRDRRRESEHTGQLRTRDEIAQQIGDQHAKDYAMLAKASDDRLVEVIAGVTREDGKVTVDASVFVESVCDTLDAFVARLRGVETTVRELAASVNIGTKNDKVLAEEVKQTADAINALADRVDDIAELFPLVKRMGDDVHLMNERVTEKLAARRNKPPRRDPGNPGAPPVN